MPRVLAIPSSTDNSGWPRSASFHQRPATITLSGLHAHGPRQIELAIDEALGAIVRVIGRGQREPVAGDETASDHRVEFGRLQTLVAEEGLQGLELVGLDVHQKAVGCVGRQALLPACQQIAAHQREQHQRHDPDAQRDDLSDGGQRAAAQVGQPEAPSETAARSGPGERTHQCPRYQRAARHGADTAAEHVDADLRVLRFPQDQPGQRQHAQRVASHAGAYPAVPDHGAAPAA